jgi:Flp pilus assembly protein TadG
MDRAAARGVRRRLRDERGQVLAIAAGGAVAFIMFVALVVDGGYGFWAKRSLQSSSDAAALAGAQLLPDSTTATNEAYAYSGRKTPQGKNYSSPLNTTTSVTTECRVGGCAAGEADTVIVTETAEVPTFFAKLIGIDSYTVKAKAVASRASTPGGGGSTPLAIYVHGLCEGGTGQFAGPIGLLANGKNMLIQGAIHINGNLKIGDSGFTSERKTALWRPDPPPQPDSPPEPGKTQGTCKWDGTSSLRIENRDDAEYCTIDCAPGLDEPVRGPWRNWVTGPQFDTRSSTITAVGGCTFNPPGKVEITTPGATIPPGVYCLAPGKEFIVNANNVTGNITVLADKFIIGGSGGNFTPYSANLLFYNTSAADPMILNPSGAASGGSYSWEGYILNRFGGIKINSDQVTSPQKGLLEAEWVEINGANFTMLGTFPDPGGGGGGFVINGPVALVE